MYYKSFTQIIDKVKTSAAVKRMAVAAAADRHTIEAAINARKAGLAHPILVGGKKEILAILGEMSENAQGIDIHDEPDGAKACEFAVRLIRDGRADFLMKGKIDTGIILKAVVNKETGLGTGSVMSLVTIYEVSGYHKLLTIVDGGMVPYPTLEQKKCIIENTVGTLLSLGYDCPKVGVLACVEKINPKMPETVEAAELAQMNKRGEIKGCVVNGPISYDCAVSKQIAELKGYSGEVAGDVDVLVAPNIHAGNIMGKILTCTCGGKLAGIVVGAKCPIVLTSRGSSVEEKLLSIMLSAAAAN